MVDVSVCLITYNHEKYIAQALDSILMQKVNFPWEVIVADDCSPDNTRSIILEYAEKHPNLINLLFQEKNVGGGKNFVDLLNAARGKYIAYIEGDDYWTDDNKLQKQFDFMEAHQDFSLCYHKIKWFYSYAIKWDEHLKESNIDDPLVTDINKLLKKGWFIRSASMFFRNFKLPIGFEKLYIGDFPLHVLLADKGNIGFINECMAVYRVHENGLHATLLNVDNNEKKIKSFESLIQMHHFLNLNTKYKYSKIFEQNIITLFINLLMVSYKMGVSVFFRNLKKFISAYGLIFTIRNLTQKSVLYTKNKYF